MSTFDASHSNQFFNFHNSLETKLLETEKYLSMRRNFIEFQNWSSENNSVVLVDGIDRDDILCKNDFGIDEAVDDEELADELSQLFSSDDLLDKDELIDELDRLEDYLAESQTVLVACPQNMPRWETAWWGEKVLEALTY